MLTLVKPFKCARGVDSCAYERTMRWYLQRVTLNLHLVHLGAIMAALIRTCSAIALLKLLRRVAPVYQKARKMY